MGNSGNCVISTKLLFSKLASIEEIRRLWGHSGRRKGSAKLLPLQSIMAGVPSWHAQTWHIFDSNKSCSLLEFVTAIAWVDNPTVGEMGSSGVFNFCWVVALSSVAARDKTGDGDNPASDSLWAQQDTTASVNRIINFFPILKPINNCWRTHKSTSLNSNRHKRIRFPHKLHTIMVYLFWILSFSTKNVSNNQRTKNCFTPSL